MPDALYNRYNGLVNDAVDITPSDTAGEVPNWANWIMVRNRTALDDASLIYVSVVMRAGSTITLVLAPGNQYPIRIKQVRATGTLNPTTTVITALGLNGGD